MNERRYMVWQSETNQPQAQPAAIPAVSIRIRSNILYLLCSVDDK